MVPNALILLSMISSGLWGVFHKKAVEVSSSHSTILLVYFFQLVQLPFAGLFCFVQGVPQSLDGMAIIQTLLTSILGAVALAVCLNLLSRLEASFVLGCTAFYPVIAFFLAVWLLGEQLTVHRFVGTFVAGLGVLIISRSNSGESILDKGSHGKRANLSLSVVAMIFLVAVCWAAIGILYKMAVGSSSVQSVYFFRCVWDSLIFIGLALFLNSREPKPLLSRMRIVKQWIFCACASICTGVGNLAYLGALSMCEASLVISLTACYPIVLFIFSTVFLNEKLSLQRGFGVVLIVTGSILVQLKQVGL